ncbi:MAG TPA: hypothetical protein VLC53_00220, partial [Myxococcota bacterium]|nr:hypothetical protein [Myxococcota bacterium]
MRKGRRVGVLRAGALAFVALLGLGSNCGPSSCPPDFEPFELPEFLFGLSQVPADAIAIAQEVGASYLRPTLSWRVVEPTLTVQGLT